MRITESRAKQTISQPAYEAGRERCLRPEELTPGQNYLARLITKPYRPRQYAEDFLVVFNELTQDREIPVLSLLLAPYSRLSMAAILPARYVDDTSDVCSVDELGILYGNRVLLSMPLNREIGYFPELTQEAIALMADPYADAQPSRHAKA
jgi:hypothetical protein